MSPRVAPLDGSARMAAQVQGRGEASAEDYGKTFSVNHIATTHDFTPPKSIGYKKTMSSISTNMQVEER